MKLTNYNVQKDLYSFFSEQYRLLIEIKEGQVYLTKQSDEGTILYPYDDIEDAKADMNAIIKTVNGSND